MDGVVWWHEVLSWGFRAEKRRVVWKQQWGSLVALQWGALFTDADGRPGEGWQLAAKVPSRCDVWVSYCTAVKKSCSLSETWMGVALLNTRFLSLQEFERGYFWSFSPRNGIIGINSLYFLVFILRHLRLKQPLFSACRILALGSSSPSQAASRARRKKKSTEKTCCCQEKNKNGGKKDKGRKSSWEVNKNVSGGMNSLQKWLSGRQGPLFICPIDSGGSPRASGPQGSPRPFQRCRRSRLFL